MLGDYVSSCMSNKPLSTLGRGVVTWVGAIVATPCEALVGLLGPHRSREEAMLWLQRECEVLLDASRGGSVLIKILSDWGSCAFVSSIKALNGHLICQSHISHCSVRGLCHKLDKAQKLQELILGGWARHLRTLISKLRAKFWNPPCHHLVRPRCHDIDKSHNLDKVFLAG